MNAVLDQPVLEVLHPQPCYDPAEPFGGLGMLRRFSKAESLKLNDLGFLDPDSEYELFDGHIVRKWPFNPETPNRGMTSLRRFTVEEYHELIHSGILSEGERVELLEGYLVLKMSHTPAHDFSSSYLEDLIRGLIPPELCLRGQKSITLKKSEPEPDIAVVIGPQKRYRRAHPVPSDIFLVIEVAYSSLLTDRRDKAAIYAAAAIPEYWVVNVEEGQIEVFTQPMKGQYTATHVYRGDARIPLVLDGKPCGEIAVHELF